VIADRRAKKRTLLFRAVIESPVRLFFLGFILPVSEFTERMSRIESVFRTMKFQFKSTTKKGIAFLKILFFFCIICINTVKTQENGTILAEFAKKMLLLDFEKDFLPELQLTIKSNSSFSPEMKMTDTITSPDLESSGALLLRLPRGSVLIPWDIRFKNPLNISGYLTELEFNVYSNKSGGDLYMLIRDTNFETSKLLIAKLNYSGWKKHSIKIGNKLKQQDYIVGKETELQMLGFLYQPAETNSVIKEDLIVLDDIIYYSFEKYKLINKK
jgi:hypothetical protein